MSAGPLPLVAALACAINTSCTSTGPQLSLEVFIGSQEASTNFVRPVQLDDAQTETIYVTGCPLLSRNDVAHVYWTTDALGRPALGIDLTEPAAKVMRAATAGNLGRRMVIEIDDALICAPVIRSVIGPKAIITSGEGTRSALNAFAVSMGAEPMPRIVPGKGLRVP